MKREKERDKKIKKHGEKKKDALAKRRTTEQQG